MSVRPLLPASLRIPPAPDPDLFERFLAQDRRRRRFRRWRVCAGGLLLGGLIGGCLVLLMLAGGWIARQAGPACHAVALR